MFVILYSIPCKSCELEETEWFRRSRCTNSFDTEAPLLGLDWSITNGIVSSKIYDKREEFLFWNLQSLRLSILCWEKRLLCYIGLVHSHVSLGSPIHGCFFVVSMFCLSMLCRSPVQRLCNEEASLLTYSITHFFVVGWFLFRVNFFEQKKKKKKKKKK